MDQCLPLFTEDKEAAICDISRGQADPNVAQILLFFCNVLIFYRGFGMNLTFRFCGTFLPDGDICIFHC